MQRKVDSIAVEHALDKAPAATSEQGDTPSTEAEQFRAGKRADHDTLPAEIQALFVENADIMRKMRELYLRCELLSKLYLCTDTYICRNPQRVKEVIRRFHIWSLNHQWRADDETREWVKENFEIIKKDLGI